MVEVRIDEIDRSFEGMTGRPATAPTPATIRSRLFSTFRIRRRGDGEALGAFIFTGLGTALGKMSSTVICGVQLAEQL